MVLAGVAAASTVYEPLKDTTTVSFTGESIPANITPVGWLNSSSYKTGVTIDASANSITFAGNDWARVYADYRFENLITLGKEQVLTFSFTINRPTIDETTNGVTVTKSLSSATVAFVGSEKAIVMGHDESGFTSAYSKLQVGTSSNVADATTGVGAHGYLFANAYGAVASVTSSASLDGGVPFGTSTISGSISWVDDQFVLTMSSSEVQEGEITYELGENVDLRDIVISMNATTSTKPTISNLRMEIASVPEPATATLSLLALAGLASRRRRK